jgi:hypothetical protein
MSVLHEALTYLGIAGGSHRYDRAGAGTALTRQEQRELAVRMRTLPGRFADRLSASAFERITGAAAAGRWEQAVEELIIALCARVAPVTHAEHKELRAVLASLNMAHEQLDAMLVKG